MNRASDALIKTGPAPVFLCLRSRLTACPERSASSYILVVPPAPSRLSLCWSVSVTPLDLVAGSLIDITHLSEMPSRPGQRLRTAGFRLPGWTGGKGFFLGDGRTYAVAIPAAGLSAPRSWEPVVVQGRWLNDEWGMGWLQVEGFAAA